MLGRWILIPLGSFPGLSARKAAEKLIGFSHEYAVEMYKAIDLALNPWGKWGVVPDEPGPYFWEFDGEIELVVLYNSGDMDFVGGAYSPKDVLDICCCSKSRFRRRIIEVK